MIANKLANLTDAELQLMEKILHKEFLYEAEQNKTWKTKKCCFATFCHFPVWLNCVITAAFTVTACSSFLKFCSDFC